MEMFFKPFAIMNWDCKQRLPFRLPSNIHAKVRIEIIIIIKVNGDTTTRNGFNVTIVPKKNSIFER